MRHDDDKKRNILYKHFAHHINTGVLFGSRDEQRVKQKKKRTHFQININSTSPKSLFVQGIIVCGDDRRQKTETTPVLISTQFTRQLNYEIWVDGPNSVLCSTPDYGCDKHDAFCMKRACCRKQIYTSFMHNHPVCVRMRMWKIVSVSPSERGGSQLSKRVLCLMTVDCKELHDTVSC